MGSASPRTGAEPEARVELRAVSLGYRSTPVVSGVDLRLGPGEVMTIIGGSGSGKSTLLRAMTGLLPPRCGVVRLFGEDLYALAPEHRGHLLSRTGLLFQHDALFGSMSVLDNVMFPIDKVARLPAPVMREMARIKLALLGVGMLADRMPADVSGGQRKRAALARATVLDPELVLCDEPTAGLDPINANTLARLLLRLRDTQGTTVVAVTHDMEMVRLISDRTLVVDEGRIKACASPRALERSEDPRVRAFFGREPGNHAPALHEPRSP